MKPLKCILLWSMIFLSVFVLACGSGGSGTTSDTGTVTMSVTDAKPMLPAGVKNFYVTFSEVWVHKPGDGWIMLELVKSPYTIDLLQFDNGTTTELVPPALLASGKYTQVRFVLDSASLGISYEGETETVPVEIPSEFLRTDKNFTIDVDPGSAVDLVVHFDLSMSLVISGTESEPKYSLKPVLHLFGDPLNAFVINGVIDNESISGESGQAIVTVISHTNDEMFTKVSVAKSNESENTAFNIFWIVPDKGYTVEIDLDQDGIVDCRKIISENDFEEGQILLSNGDGNIIAANEGICAL